jgi:hypothetical protein
MGQAGPQGPSGKRGEPGTDGKDGKDGSNGKDGEMTNASFNAAIAPYTKTADLKGLTMWCATGELCKMPVVQGKDTGIDFGQGNSKIFNKFNGDLTFETDDTFRFRNNDRADVAVLSPPGNLTLGGQLHINKTDGKLLQFNGGQDSGIWHNSHGWAGLAIVGTGNPRGVKVWDDLRVNNNLHVENDLRVMQNLMANNIESAGLKTNYDHSIARTLYVDKICSNSNRDNGICLDLTNQNTDGFRVEMNKTGTGQKYAFQLQPDGNIGTRKINMSNNKVEGETYANPRFTAWP